MILKDFLHIVNVFVKLSCPNNCHKNFHWALKVCFGWRTVGSFNVLCVYKFVLGLAILIG